MSYRERPSGDAKTASGFDADPRGSAVATTRPQPSFPVLLGSSEVCAGSLGAPVGGAGLALVATAVGGLLAGRLQAARVDAITTAVTRRLYMRIPDVLSPLLVMRVPQSASV
jgi:hypothetical protein